MGVVQVSGPLDTPLSDNSASAKPACQVSTPARETARLCYCLQQGGFTRNCQKQRYSCPLGNPGTVGGPLHTASPTGTDRQARPSSRTLEIASRLAESSWESQVQNGSLREQHIDPREPEAACSLFPLGADFFCGTQTWFYFRGFPH